MMKTIIAVCSECSGTVELFVTTFYLYTRLIKLQCSAILHSATPIFFFQGASMTGVTVAAAQWGECTAKNVPV